MRYLVIIFFVLSSALSFSQMDDKGGIKIRFDFDEMSQSFEDTLIIKYFHVEGQQTITDTFHLKEGCKIPYRLFESGTYTIEISGNKITSIIITDVLVKSYVLTFIDDIILKNYQDSKATIRLKYKKPIVQSCG